MAHDLVSKLHQPVDSVDVKDLKSFFATWRQLCDNLPPDSAIEQEGTVGFDLAVLSRSIDGNSEPFALWLRTSIIESMLKFGALTAWLEGGVPADPVFALMARWPIPDVTAFRCEDFVSALHVSAA